MNLYNLSQLELIQMELVIARRWFLFYFNQKIIKNYRRRGYFFSSLKLILLMYVLKILWLGFEKAQRLY